MGAGGSKPEASAGAKHIFARYVYLQGTNGIHVIANESSSVATYDYCYMDFDSEISMAWVGAALVEKHDVLLKERSLKLMIP